MALTPTSPEHEDQIEAGIRGRNRGHAFEKALAADISRYIHDGAPPPDNLSVGRPSELLVRYLIHREGLNDIQDVEGWWLGGHATGAGGDELLAPDGSAITESKSDVVVKVKHKLGTSLFGVSTKTCSAESPTNAQLFFTTAEAFCRLLRANGIDVSQDAERSMRMFCGDNGYRPSDMVDTSERLADDRRWFWEELPEKGRKEWEKILDNRQDKVTKILLQKAYPNDPYPPEYILHKTKKSNDIDSCEVALFTVDELVDYSSSYHGFKTRNYGVAKGTFKDDPNTHKAPRFGFIQFQRGGQKQHPTQLQFNLKSGYFYKT